MLMFNVQIYISKIRHLLSGVFFSFFLYFGFFQTFEESEKVQI